MSTVTDGAQGSNGGTVAIKAAERNAVAKALNREYESIDEAALAALSAHRDWLMARERYMLLFNGGYVVGPFTTINEADTFATKNNLNPDEVVRVTWKYPEEV